MGSRRARLDMHVFTEGGSCPTCGALCPTCEGGSMEFDSIRVHADGSFRLYHECASCGESTMARDPAPRQYEGHGVVIE